MLFNSYSFMFIFVPAVFAIHWLALRVSQDLGILVLTLASLFFYGWWDIRFLPLLLTSIIFNFIVGRQIQDSTGTIKRIWLVGGLTLNLAVLFFFKYVNFFIAVAGDVGFHRYDTLAIILPIGISFITFQKIAYLVDIYDGKSARYSLVHFALFVSFFPQLIAGPIVHHSQIVPQFDQITSYRHYDIATGLSIFAAGLFKKVVIADNLAQFSTPIFLAADAGSAVTMLEAWGGVLAYTFQIYYDFSGYCDMAIGLALLFGIRIPINFNSPYKATSIVDFWRRWHITLSQFLRDYLYIRLGGNRHGNLRRYVNLMTTMLLGGLWHGAGWGFIIWGGLHGIYLAVNHLARNLSSRHGWGGGSILTSALARIVTFLAVVFAWVFFRATTIDGASALIASMSGTQGLTVPAYYLDYLSSYGEVLQGYGLEFRGPGHIPPRDWALVGAPLILAAWGCAWFMPNTNQIFLLNTGEQHRRKSGGVLAWTPSRLSLLSIAILFSMAVLFASTISEFLYFQF